MAHDLPDHDHDHEQEPPSDIALRVKALESLLVEKGLVDPAALDAIVDHYEHKVGPRNGAKVVAKAWADPAYRERQIARAAEQGRTVTHQELIDAIPKLQEGARKMVEGAGRMREGAKKMREKKSYIYSYDN